MDFRKRIEQGRQSIDRPEPANSNEQEADFNYFGVGSVQDHIASIDFRMADGARKALTYSYVMGIDYDPESGIELYTATKIVKITGRDLERLYDDLVLFKVKYIRENMGLDAGKAGLFIKNIVIQEL